MNTTKWGPDCWNLLFNIALSYPDTNKIPDLDLDVSNFYNDVHAFINKKNFTKQLDGYEDYQIIRIFFRIIGEVLPCKYCRNSYRGEPETNQVGFINEDPIEPFLRKRIDLFRYVYNLKDKVNKKLYGQEMKGKRDPEKLRKNISPPFEEVWNRRLKNYRVTSNSLDGWIFFYCIAMNYKDEPTQMDKDSYLLFFNLLPYIAPIPQRGVYKQFFKENPVDISSRDALLRWLYSLNSKIIKYIQNRGIAIPNIAPYNNVCSYYEDFRAKCNNATKTCDISTPKK